MATETVYPGGDGEGEKDIESEETSNSPPKQESMPSSEPTSAPPNGGVIAWLHVAGSFLLLLNTWGNLNTFPAFQSYYETGQLFRASSSDISWIGSVQSYVLLFFSLVAGPIYDRGYFKTLIWVGGFLIVFGYMMLSLCKEYWQVMLAQGITIGLGMGCIFVPALGILAQYFTSRFGIASGFATAGSSMGGIIYPIVLTRLLPRIGFHWSVRVVGFIALGTLLIPATTMRMRVRPPKIRELLDLSAFLEPAYSLFLFVMLITYFGFFVLLFYYSYYAREQHLTSPSLAFYLITIFNASSCFGRIIPNMLADRIGPFNVIAPGVSIAGVLTFCMLVAHDEAAIIVLVIFAGFFSATITGLPPMCFKTLTEDKSKLGTRMGQGWVIVGLGLLAGPTSAGAVLGTNKGDLHWTRLWIMGGVLLCCSGIGFVMVRFVKYGTKQARA